MQCRRPRFNPWGQKIPWRRERPPTPVFLPREFNGQRSLAGYSPWGHKMSDMTERLSLHFTLQIHTIVCKTILSTGRSHHYHHIFQIAGSFNQGMQKLSAFNLQVRRYLELVAILCLCFSIKNLVSIPDHHIGSVRNRVTDIENKFMVTKGEAGSGWGGWNELGYGINMYDY